MVEVVTDTGSFQGILDDEFLEGLCEPTLTRDQVMNFAEEATHLLLVRRDGNVVTFGLLQSGAKVNELLVLCGRSQIDGVKGSRLIVDKAMEIGKSYKNTTLELTAASDGLAKKVYEPMGFTRKENSLRMSRTIGGSRLKKQTRRTKRHTRGHKHRKLRNLASRRR